MEVFCYIDTVSYRLIKEIYSDLNIKSDDPEKVIDEIRYYEYQWIEGTLLPKRVGRYSYSNRGSMTVEMNFSNYKLNPTFDDNFFECHPIVKKE